MSLELENPQISENLEEILAACSVLMAKKGFHGASMRELALATGRSLSGLYHYFKNKEELLYLINFTGFNTVKERLEDIIAQTDDPRKRLYGLIENHIVYFAAHLDEMRILMYGTLPLNKAQDEIIKKLKEDYYLLGQNIVKAVIIAKEGKSPDPGELSRRTYFLFGMINWIFSWYDPELHGTPQDLAKDAYRQAEPASRWSETWGIE